MKQHPKSYQQDGAAADQRWHYNGSVWVPKGVYEHSVGSGEQSTTSDTFVQAHRHTTASLPSANYIIEWYFYTRHSTVSWAVIWQVELDDTTELVDSHLISTKDAGAQQRRPVYGFSRQALNGVHTIDIDFQREPSTGTAYVGALRIMVRDAS
jgi:hypothetical protein